MSVSGDWLTVMEAAKRRGVSYRVLFHAVERGQVYSRCLIAPPDSRGRPLWAYVHWADVEAWSPKPRGRPRGTGGRRLRQQRSPVTEGTHHRFCEVMDGLEPTATWPLRGVIPKLSRRDPSRRRDE